MFNTGNSASQAYILPDDIYRTLILTKALANIVATNAASMNQLLRNLFPGRGRAYVRDNGAMSMTFVFEFALTAAEYAILTESGALPHPAGVMFNVVVIPVGGGGLFGFSEAGTSARPFGYGAYYMPAGYVPPPTPPAVLPTITAEDGDAGYAVGYDIAGFGSIADADAYAGLLVRTAKDVDVGAYAYTGFQLYLSANPPGVAPPSGIITGVTVNGVTFLVADAISDTAEDEDRAYGWDTGQAGLIDGEQYEVELIF